MKEKEWVGVENVWLNFVNVLRLKGLRKPPGLRDVK